MERVRKNAMPALPSAMFWACMISIYLQAEQTGRAAVDGNTHKKNLKWAIEAALSTAAVYLGYASGPAIAMLLAAVIRLEMHGKSVMKKKDTCNL